MKNDFLDILVFQLGAEQYGIDLLAVQEIRSYDTVTRIANAPDFIKGVMNLRGVIVPIIDMRLRFNTGEASFNALTVAIILSVGSKVLGMVVDGVSDVVTLTPDQIKPAPDLGRVVSASCITGIATVDTRLITLLDVPSLLACAEVEQRDDVLV
jgi:purine-binding chemotaxis protein CheW